MTNEWRCPHCARYSFKEKDIVMVLCVCGEYMKKVNRAILSNDMTKDNQIILKTIINRGIASGKQSNAEQMIEQLEDRKIKVNLK